MAEADRIDRDEDGRYGEARGDELPEALRTVEGRREALRALGVGSLQAQRAGREGTEPEDPVGARAALVDLDPEVIVGRVQGRRGWLREACHQLEEQREREAKPIARLRSERLLEVEQRLGEDLVVEHAANRAYEAYRTRGVMKDGRRFGGPPKPHVAAQEPAGTINLTDPDSRKLKGFPWPGRVSPSRWMSHWPIAATGISSRWIITLPTGSSC